VNLWPKHLLRVTVRLFWLVSELFLAAVNYAIHCALFRRESLSVARAAWLHRTTQRMLKVFHVETQVFGNIPSNGLLVCNHLG